MNANAPDPTGLWIPLDFSRIFVDRENAWMLLEIGGGIRIRATIGRDEYVQEVPLRWRMPEKQRPQAVFVRPLDASGESWLTAPFHLDPGLLKVQLHLRCCPRVIADALRRC